MKKLSLLLVCFLLSGCEMGEQSVSDELQAQMNVFNEASAVCTKNGLKQGTPENKNCADGLVQNYVADVQRRRMAAVALFTGMAPPPLTVAPIPNVSQNRMINCNSTALGNSVQTNCY